MITKDLNTPTIQKTLFTTLAMDGFWDRWIAHGVLPEDLIRIRHRFHSLSNWVEAWEQLAKEKEIKAGSLLNVHLREEAEGQYRLAALYYNLNQWIYPNRSNEKQRGYQQMVQASHKADSISQYGIVFGSVYVDNVRCQGRIGLPTRPKGVIVIFNPIDSTKEELVSYESDFVRNGLITVSFDGPGQGSTYIENQLKGDRRRWKIFVQQVIDYADRVGKVFSKDMPIYLFGTSSGASWALYASKHTKVQKVIAVSPAISLIEKGVTLPVYFMERLREVVNGVAHFIPEREQDFQCPVLLFHGNQDVMVKQSSIEDLYTKLPKGSELIEFEDEGHCCNNKLPEVRQIAVNWLEEGRNHDY